MQPSDLRWTWGANRVLDFGLGLTWSAAFDPKAMATELKHVMEGAAARAAAEAEVDTIPERSWWQPSLPSLPYFGDDSASQKVEDTTKEREIVIKYNEDSVAKQQTFKNTAAALEWVEHLIVQK
eukprot:COSAG02_NODE_1256_length_13576_cov_12.901981_3_plen_124_part_00